MKFSSDYKKQKVYFLVQLNESLKKKKIRLMNKVFNITLSIISTFPRYPPVRTQADLIHFEQKQGLLFSLSFFSLPFFFFPHFLICPFFKLSELEFSKLHYENLNVAPLG